MATSKISDNNGAAEKFGLFWDVLIILLVAVNLSLILFDTAFAYGPIEAAIANLSPEFADWYRNQIHSRFLQIDLIFVGVFFADFLAGWLVATVGKRYHRWFFYPFVHWYDLLGCIPLAGFRWLRALRVLALMLRLHRMGWINIREWQLYRTLMKYYDIVLEELSDRIVVKVLSGVQDEVREGGGDLPRRVITQVLQPRKQALDSVIASGLRDLIQGGYLDNSSKVQAFIENIVEHSVEKNSAARSLEKLPLVGRYAVKAIDETITSTVLDVLDSAMRELGEDEYLALVEHVSSALFNSLSQSETVNDSAFSKGLIETIDLLIAQVSERRWKQRYT